MAIAPFLAMTAAEIGNTSRLPEQIAWMACQFSLYSTGLSNMPDDLPPGSVLMLSDQVPFHGHDPIRILRELEHCAARHRCRAVVLDFQRADNPETAHLVSELTKLSFPLVVSQDYAREQDCGVLLSPVPASVSLAEYLAPWQGREIWLELALDGETISLTEEGAKVTPLPYPDQDRQGFPDKSLHCHYQMLLKENAAEFILWRTKEDLYEMLEEAEALGVAGAVGLYQELEASPR